MSTPSGFIVCPNGMRFLASEIVAYYELVTDRKLCVFLRHGQSKHECFYASDMTEEQMDALLCAAGEHT